MWRMRPVPVVLLLLAFCPHSYDLILAAGNPQAAHSLCCLWKLRLLHRRQTVCVLVWRLPKEVVPFVTVGGAQRRNQVSLFPPTASPPCPCPALLSSTGTSTPSSSSSTPPTAAWHSVLTLEWTPLQLGLEGRKAGGGPNRRNGRRAGDGALPNHTRQFGFQGHAQLRHVDSQGARASGARAGRGSLALAQGREACSQSSLSLPLSPPTSSKVSKHGLVRG